MKNGKFSLWLATASFALSSLNSALAATYLVQMTGGLTFSPSSISIAQGDTILWTNSASFHHTSTSGSPPGTPNGLWNSGTVNPPGTYLLTFSNFSPATYPYYCNFHFSSGMVGQVTVTNATLAPPSISITNPTAGATFRAPANIALMASASQANGSVTNVQFFSGAALLGGVASAPYNFTVNNAAAANYNFTAVAANNQGTMATSAVVNVLVLTNAILTAPTHLADRQFQFTVLGIPGQTYAAEASSNLMDWFAISTNVAPADTFNILDRSATNAVLRFYRVRQDLF